MYAHIPATAGFGVAALIAAATFTPAASARPNASRTTSPESALASSMSHSNTAAKPGSGDSRIGPRVPKALCFTTKQNIFLNKTGTGGDSLRQADLNGDGRPDLVVGGNGTGGSFAGGLDVLLNKGRLRFGKPSTYLLGHDISDVAMADMNVDGNLDVLALDHSAGAVIVLEGDGTGGLHRGVSIPVDPSPDQILAKDFNGDGYPDLAILYESRTFDVVAVVVSDDAGGYGAPVDYPAGPPFPAGFTARDMDGDGHPDLVIANYGPDYQVGAFSILYGESDGSFEHPESIGAGVNPVVIAAGDLNEDGMRDIVLGLNNGPQGIQIFLNQGDKQFQDAGTYPLRINTRDPLIKDLNGDGHVDIAVGMGPYGQPRDVAVFAGRGDGTFDGDAAIFGSQSGGNGLVALGNRKDATPDLAAENYQYSGFPQPSVSILANCS